MYFSTTEETLFLSLFHSLFVKPVIIQFVRVAKKYRVAKTLNPILWTKFLWDRWMDGL